PEFVRNQPLRQISTHDRHHAARASHHVRQPLTLEQLRDIIAEHGMDHDRLAMKWKDPQRVIDRIVERVESRTAKGAAFRGRPEQSTEPPGAGSGPKIEDSPA
ncbi:hypothetical protein ACGFYH_34245, partial [Streptomyces sp. NPDC048392]